MGKFSARIKLLPEEDKLLLDSLIQVKEFKKGELVFDATNFDSNIYYVVKGILRRYILKEENEKTLDFYFSDALHFPTILTQGKRTNCYLQAIDSSIVYKLDSFKFEELKKSKPEVLLLENMILEFAYMQTIERLKSFQTMNATERYLDLLEKDPKIVQYIPLTHIASYLGINNASLSKIRSSLK